MKKRVSAILLALVLCLTLLPAAAYADGGTAVYVRSDGNDGTGDGSADKPFATLAKMRRCLTPSHAAMALPHRMTLPANGTTPPWSRCRPTPAARAPV